MKSEAQLNELKTKYEAIMVIAREARRINNRLQGQNVDFKVTSLAVSRYLEEKVKFEYWEPPKEADLLGGVAEGLAAAPGGMAAPVDLSVDQVSASVGRADLSKSGK